MSGRERMQHSAVSAERRRLYRRKLLFVSPEELAACRQDPRKAKTIRGPDAIVCLECGQLLRSLSGHLGQEHSMTAAEYKAKAGPDGATRRYDLRRGLVCENLSRRMSKRSSSVRFLRHLSMARAKRGPGVVQKMMSKRPRSRSLESRLRLGDQMRGKSRPDLWTQSPDGQVVTDWRIAQLRLQAKTFRGIGSEVGVKADSVHQRLRKMGFPARPCRFLFGEPVTGRHIVRLCEDLEITRRETAKQLNLPERRVYFQTRVSQIDRQLAPEMADRVAVLRNKLIDEWRSRSATVKGGHPWSLLPSEAAALHGKYQVLRSELKALRDWLKDQDSTTMQDVWAWLCEQSRRRAVRLLLFLHEFYDWIKKENDQGHFLTGDWAPFDLAAEFLAKAYRVSVGTILNRCNAASVPLAPAQVRIRQRWNLGRALLAERDANGGKRLPPGRREEAIRTTGKDYMEVTFCMRLAARYPTEEELANALQTFGSWRQICLSLK